MKLKALRYHRDINFDEPIQMINGEYSWFAIERRLNEISKFPEKVFEKHPYK